MLRKEKSPANTSFERGVREALGLAENASNEQALIELGRLLERAGNGTAWTYQDGGKWSLGTTVCADDTAINR